MNAIQLGAGTVAASTRRAELDAAENPRTRRFCINPGVSLLEVHPTLSGRQRALIPHGFPVRFDTFNGMRTRNWSVDPEDKSPPDVETDLTAKEAVENVKLMAWQGSRDMGFRELEALTTMTDDEAGKLLASVFPALDPENCRYPSQNTYEFIVEECTGDVVTSRAVKVFACVTCALDWLESDECKARAAAGAARRLRDDLLDAYSTNYKFFQAKWGEWKSELIKRERGEAGIATLSDAHEHVMRQLHETRPADAAAETIRENQQAQADAQLDGMREFAKTFAEEMQASRQPAQPMNLDDIKRRLLDDPEFRRMLAAEAAQQEPEKKKPGTGK